MVAQKRGRGAKAQPAKAKPAQPAEEQAPETEMAETVEAEDNNGDTEQLEQADEAAGGDAAEGGAEQEADQATDTDGQAKPEEKKEEKVESGKLLVENLPSSFLFDYQDKLKELFSKYGEVTNVKRGPIIVTELTTTPTLSAIVEFKNKDSLDKALTEEGTVLDGSAISVAVESRAETAVLVGVPYEASTDYVRLLFAQCGPVAHIHEFSKTKYKILRVTFHEKECVEKALKLDRELRINGFLVTVSKYRDEDEQKAHSANVNKNKRQHPAQQGRNNANSGAASSGNNAAANRAPPAFRGARGGGGGGGAGAFPARGGNFRGARGRGGFPGRGAFRGGFAPANNYLPPPQPFMGRPSYLM